MKNNDTTNDAMNNLRNDIKALGVLPEFDQNLLFTLERKYFDFVDLSNFKLENINNKIDYNASLRIIRVKSINHLETADIGLHLQNFSNLLAVMKNPHYTLFGIIKGSDKKTELFYGLVESNINQNQSGYLDINDYFAKNLFAAFKSSFPGMSYEPIDSETTTKEITDRLNNYHNVSALPGIPSLRNKNTKESYFQGIDRFIEGMQGSDYMLLIIAEPIPLLVINSMIKNLYDLSSDIHSFVKQTVMKTKGTTDSVNVGVNFNIFSILSKTLSLGLSAIVGPVIPSLGYSRTKSSGTSKGGNIGYTRTWQRSTSISVETFNKQAEYAEKLCNKYIERLQAGKNMGFWNVGVYLLSENVYEQSKGTSLLSSILSGDETHYEPIRSIPLSPDVKEAYLKYFANPRYKTLLYGDEDYIKLKMKNELKMFKFLKKRNNDKSIDKYKDEFLKLSKGKQDDVLKEIENITGDEDIRKEIDDQIEKTWNELKESQSAHPLGAVMGGVSTPLNTEELSIIMNLPRKEINGVPVLQKTEFGRNIRYFTPKSGKSIDIGELRYLGKGENNRLELNINSLCSHTFVTGSTGSGKTNTVFNLLDKLSKEDIKFLVIEPVKGEYKKVFGGIDGVNVYGTNRKHTEVLRINPFRFPQEIHVLEHLDRLIEIFNATWPMYAAMPALLKDAIEQVYEKKGWDLEESINLKEKPEYPTVQDLVKIMPVVIQQSGYSDEVKSNYYGALVSRLKSLTNGLYRQIFTDEEIDNTKLFDDNCIIDISRIGSMETKALLMGIIFMRMYEYRLSEAKEFNVGLKHITVMEEAHHLMRKTSFAQNEEYANIQGKAVEMITNSLAEMRTYGEGFILVDQAPTLLDLSAIRNTNTKIILRLPDQSDKEVVGFSTNLNDNQIRELSRLETGEAVVYQNDWLQAVTGIIDEYKERSGYKYNYSEAFTTERTCNNDIVKVLLNPIVSDDNKIDLRDIDVERLKNWLSGHPVNSKVKSIIEEILEQREEHSVYQDKDFKTLAEVVAGLFAVENVLLVENATDNVEEWNEKLYKMLEKRIDFPNNEFKVEFLHLILCNYAHQMNMEETNRFYFSWVEKNIPQGRLV